MKVPEVLLIVLYSDCVCLYLDSEQDQTTEHQKHILSLSTRVLFLDLALGLK
jgi:hypothetical protein